MTHETRPASPERRQARVGKVISRLVRQALAGSATDADTHGKSSSATGFQPFPARGIIVTNELIDRLRRELDAAAQPDASVGRASARQNNP